MTNFELERKIGKEAKLVLFYAYKTSETFPSSCGLVSGLLARIIASKNLLPEYDVFYVRGLHLTRSELNEGCKYSRNEDATPCDDYCDFCTGVNEHSWIEIVKKGTDEKTILDFTSIQFDEEAFLIEECLFDEDFCEDGLYYFLEENSYFIVEQENKKFQDYIPKRKVLNGEEVESRIQEMYEYFEREST